jgi:phosphate transport system permease protein
MRWTLLHGFVNDESWHPLSGTYGLLPMLCATTVTSLGAVTLAAPIGVATAVYAEYYSPTFIRVFLMRVVEVLAGIPSVVIGLWGLTRLTPLLAQAGGSGQNVTAATLVLALMIFPTVALTTGSALRGVSADIRSAGIALGLNRTSLVCRVLLPAAARSIAAGVLLALLRAVGETMAVLMVAGNVVQWPTSLTAPIRTVTGNIALELGYAGTEHRSVLFFTGLLLIVVVLALVAAVRWLTVGRESLNDA